MFPSMRRSKQYPVRGIHARRAAESAVSHGLLPLSLSFFFLRNCTACYLQGWDGHKRQIAQSLHPTRFSCRVPNQIASSHIKKNTTNSIADDSHFPRRTFHKNVTARGQYNVEHDPRLHGIRAGRARLVRSSRGHGHGHGARTSARLCVSACGLQRAKANNGLFAC
jgi:hypothetical protein